MNRSSSEICFQKFLQGDEGSPLSGEPDLSAACNGVGDHLVEIKASQPLDRSPTADVDPGEYAAVLKRKLDMYCAAVVKSRGSKDAPLVDLQSSANGYVAGGGLSQLATQNSGVGIKSATSCLSKELPEENEEDLEGGNATNEDMGPANAKRMRRMLSNRESARRSRRRKHAHMNDIETEVLQLRVENASLLKCLTDMTQKYNETSVDNRVLKADVETMRAKVKMAEDNIKRVTSLDDELYRSISDMSEVTIPFSLGPHDKLSDMAVPAKGAAHFFRKPSNEVIHPSDIDRTGMVMERSNIKIGSSRSLKRVASLEFLQKKLCARSS